MKRALQFIVFMIISGKSIGQVNQFWLVQQLYNPAVTGLEHDHEVHALGNYFHPNSYFEQQRGYLSYSAKIDKWKSGIGFTLGSLNYPFVVTNRTDGELTYAFHWKLKEKSVLSSGVSLGIHHYNFADLISNTYSTSFENDTLYGGKGAAFSADFGLNYTLNRFRLGMSAGQITKGKVSAGDFDFREEIGYSFYSSYYFGDSSGFSFQPVILFGKENQFYDIHIGLVSSYKEMVSLGLTTRSRDSYSFSVGYTFKKMITLSYGFQTTLSKLNNTNFKGVHELHLGIKLNRKME